jgi:hypothetical protein
VKQSVDPLSTSPSDPAILLLQALAWICTDATRADRLLGLTGLSATDLRDRAMEPAVLNAIGDFMRAHEPDLLECAKCIGVSPSVLASAAL